MLEEGDEERRGVVSEGKWREEYVEASTYKNNGDERALVVVTVLNNHKDYSPPVHHWPFRTGGHNGYHS